MERLVFDNGTFQVTEVEPGKLEFGFGCEYSFSEEDLVHLIAFLLCRDNPSLELKGKPLR